MSIEVYRPRPLLIAALASAAAALLLPDAAGAKFTCQDRGARPQGIALRGLPATPIARRTYTLTVVLPTVHAANPSPYLGTAYCGEAIKPEQAVATGAQQAVATGGWFRRVAGHQGGNASAFSLDIRFPHPGPWALSLMDLDGSFYDFGLRSVKPSPPEWKPTPTAARTGGPPPVAWISAVGASLAIAAGLALAIRRQRG